MRKAAQTGHEPAHRTAKQRKPLYLWVFLGLVSIVFHLGLIFSGLVPALVARPLHMALALPWLFIFGARSRRQRISGAILMLAGAAACLYTAFNADIRSNHYGFLSGGLRIALALHLLVVTRSEERRVGTEGVSTCRVRRA